MKPAQGFSSNRVGPRGPLSKNCSNPELAFLTPPQGFSSKKKQSGLFVFLAATAFSGPCDHLSRTTQSSLQQQKQQPGSLFFFAATAFSGPCMQVCSSKTTTWFILFLGCDRLFRTLQQQNNNLVHHIFLGRDRLFMTTQSSLQQQNNHLVHHFSWLGPAFQDHG